MLRKLNNYFICDSDETSKVSELIFFYGLSAMIILIGVFSLIGIVKGVN